MPKKKDETPEQPTSEPKKQFPIDDFMEQLRHCKRGGLLNTIDIENMLEYFESVKASESVN